MKHAVALTAALGACLVAAAQPAAGARRTIPAANPARLGAEPVGPIRDVVKGLPGTARAAASADDVIPADASRGTYEASGMNVSIAVSPSYAPDDAISQGWADYFASLPQAADVETMTAYFAPLEEMQSLCSPEAVACYYPAASLLVLLGEPSPDSTPLEEVAAHEFGHHIANERDNDPWPAATWGPKRWATYQRVCELVSRGDLFPGDEGDGYSRNPGEGWAEAYRVAAGGSASRWLIVNNWFKPDARARSLALRDARTPWTANANHYRSGRFQRRGSSWRSYRFQVPWDGRVRLQTRATRGLDVDLYLYQGGRQLGRSLRTGSTDSLARNTCGESSSIVVALHRATGAGRFELSAAIPAG